MVGRLSRGQAWVVALALVGVWTTARAVAQGGNAMIEGVVTDQKGGAIAGATVSLRSVDGGTRTYNTKTDKNGKFTLIGIYPTEYSITASLESGNLEAVPTNRRLPAGRMTKLEFVLADKAAIAASASANTPAGKAEAERRAKLGKSFDEGVAAANAGQHDQAIAKFNESIALVPTCAMCYKNIGYSYMQKKEFDKAEEAYKKAIEVSNPPDADAYTGLANAYNAQKKFELAADASAKAAQAAPAGGAAGGGGGNADSLYAQGVNLYNANKGGEAKAAFQSAIKANANHADAHYMLGLVLVGEGDTKGALAEFQTYLKLDPEGKNASTAKAALATLK
jgi:tetratricopeptide (TPR) repeat protein